MSDYKRLIPIISLTAILLTTSVAKESHSFVNRYNVESFDTSTDLFTDCHVSDEYESNIGAFLKNSYFVPQGLALDKDHTFISFYDYFSDDKSIIKVFSNEGRLINTFSLPNTAHVGGISLDKDNNLLWVCSTFGHVDAYRLDDVIYRNNANPCYQNMNVGKNLPNYSNPFVNVASYMTVYDNNLYVGCFTINNPGKIKKYSISFDDDNAVHLNLADTIVVPSKIQGLTFYEKNGNTYLLLSRSFGCGRSSALQIFKYQDDIKDYNDPELKSVTYEFPAMMEQISTLNDKLFSLYEYEAKVYGGENENELVLRITDMDQLFKRSS